MKIYYSLILVIFASVVASQVSIFSINGDPAFSIQRVCVQACLGPGYTGVPGNIGCAYEDDVYLNACVCRTDLQPSASSYLTKCVNSGCATEPSDLSSAISIYDNYCASNGFPVPAATSFISNPLNAATATVPKATSSSISLTISSSELLLTFILSTILIHHFL
ncbi:hypothetical protein V8E54_008649 [Elaphomyces granulatus]